MKLKFVVQAYQANSVNNRGGLLCGPAYDLWLYYLPEHRSTAKIVTDSLTR